MTDVIPVILALIGVTALMCGSLYLIKRLTVRFSVGTRNGQGIRVITSVSVGQDKSVAAVRAGKKKLLVGITSGGINVLCELDDEDMELIMGTSDSEGAAAQNNGGRSFADCLSLNLKKMGKDIITPFPKNEEEKSDNENGGR